MPKELESESQMDEMFYDAWHFFLKLHSRRGSNGFGPSPLSYPEMKAFFELQQIFPTPYEIQMIELFDNVAMEMFSKKQAEQQREQERKRKK
jgi:hypothetical protein